MCSSQNGGELEEYQIFTFVKDLLSPLNNSLQFLDNAKTGDSNWVVKGFGKSIGVAELQRVRMLVYHDLMDEVAGVSHN